MLEPTLKSLKTTSAINTTSAQEPEVSTTQSIPSPAPTTGSVYKPFNPKSHNNADEEYTLNNYQFSSVNLGGLSFTYDSNLKNTALRGANNLGCDINDGNCSYNTNLNI